ncbi:unnamed protein product, partial [Adineta steineri]
MMEMALLHKVQEQKMMLSPASSAIPTTGCSQGAASFAQERIWLDEKIHHDPFISPAMHNFVLPWVVKHGSMSIERIRSAIVAVLEQHEILRTAIYFDENRNILVQAVHSVDKNDAYSFEITANDIQSFDEVADLLRNESVKHFAELEQGLVVRCHLVKMGSDDDMDKLYPQDLVIFIFHGVAFDYISISPFLVAFTKAYDQMELDVERLQYISFSLYEHQQFVNITEDSQIRRAQQFWSKMMDDYSLDANYPTPFTRPFDTKKRSGEGHSTSFILDSMLVEAQMKFASLHNLSMSHTALACFFLFIYELNDGTISDLCVTCPTENRPLVDTKCMIGTFANLLPYRIKINANESFINLVQRICQLDMDILNHCQLPYQQIIRDNSELCSNKIPFHFQYEELHSSSTSEMKPIVKTNDAILSLYTEQPWLHGNGIASHDMNLKMIHNQLSQTTLCVLECSADCYDEITVLNIVRYFQNLLLHIFTENTKTIGFDPVFEKIGNLSLLPMNVENLSNVIESLQHFSEINAVIEQHMPMIGASMFWHDALHDYKLDQSLSLPYDRYRLTTEYRSGRGTSISFNLDRDLCGTFLHYTSSQNISLEHLALSMYFVFLFKLTNGDTDLCIGMNVDGRYRDELRSVIGMFVNAIPLRCQLDPQWFLHKLVKHVEEILINSRKYSYFPLRRLLDQHPHASKPAFLDTSFEFMRYSPQDPGKDIIIGDSHLSVMPIPIKISEYDIMSKFDFIFSIQHDFHMNQLSCIINASLDLFNRETVEKMSQRFHFIVKQLSASIIDSRMSKPVYELSLTLSNEQYLMQSLNNTQTAFSSPLTCIHHEFVYQAMKHPQNLAVELDEQSLTYCELLYYVQILSLTLLNEYHVLPGEVLCQCVERSLSMVIGIMGIEMAGGVYCPLSFRDPQHRLHALTQQTQSRLVLVHWLTKMKFHNDTVTTDIHSILLNNDVMSDVDVYRLSSITVTPNDIAYIIFTSGSTGIPKAVQVRHKNFTRYMDSFVSVSALKKDDITIQMARSTFDVHLQEIVGVLSIGATLVMLHPKGIMDFDYLVNVIIEKNITYFASVPTLINNFFTFLQQQNHHNVAQYLRSVCSGGEPCSIKLINLMSNTVMHTCRLLNMYGTAETTIDCTFYLFDNTTETGSSPIGRPLANYQNLVLDQFSQSVFIDQEGELLVGGMGVFAGYLGRDDLTARALVKIDGQLFYRTGDLVRIDNTGLIHYVSRKDHQIKLHGQRIELGEIERCLLNITSISACVVMKWSNDYLVAYVQSSDINEEELREHCQCHLPPHMIPSFFIILDRLPLNQNGKIDRKLLPSPYLPSSTTPSVSELDTPVNQVEKSVYDIWCQVLEHNGRQISTTTNFFTIGGHSRLFIELYHRYQTVFGFDSHILSISPFLEQPTIQQHAKLLKTVTTDVIRREQWYTLHINQSMASFAQERIFLDEQIRFSNQHIFYNNFVALRVTEGILSIHRVLQALQLVMWKHEILRTSLVFNNNDSTLQQYVIANHNTFTFLDQQTFESDNELQNIIYRTIINPDLFDLSSGRVFSCQILQQQKTTHETAHTDFLEKSDVLVLYFHHAAVDGTSIPILLNDFYNAYSNNMTISLDEQSVQYIDYAIYERLMDMTSSRSFWYSQLERFNLKRALKLPADRHRLPTVQRSGLASIAQISFDKELSMMFLNYASLHQITPFQLGLTAFYVFLFKLTHGETDLCIASVNANRYRSELENMIGMFVSTLPYCVKLNSHWSFDELVKHVREKCLSILEHSHYPLQYILTDFRLNQLDVPFLEIAFNFLPVSTNIDRYSIGDVRLEQMSIKQVDEISQFDFSTMFLYNPTSDDHKLSCRFSCSHDLFDNTTVKTIAQRFQHLLSQLFLTNSNDMEKHLSTKSIKNLSLILREEVNEIYALTLSRVTGIATEAPASFAQARMWLDERIRFDPDKPQVAIYNMPFVYRLQSGHTLSIKQLRHALHLTVKKHPSLHTSLHFDIQKNLLMQRVITHEHKHNNNNSLFSIIETTYETDEQLNEILLNEKRNPHLFDLAQGLVFRYHIIYYNQISSNHLLSHKDILIFNFHHAFFDFPSMNIFLHDLNQAYTTGQLFYDDNTNPRYLDYAVIEQQMSMTGASMFWLDALHDCKLDQSLSLPFDRYHLSNEHPTGHSISISFDFGQDLLHDYLTHASSNNISLEYLTFAVYFIFLFKLTNGQIDLCLAMNINNNRYRDELKSIIGLFENVIPLRCQLDPHWSFHQLLGHVRDITTNSMKYSYFPLQRILNQHPHISKHAFLDTSLEFISYKSSKATMIGDSQLVPESLSFDINEDDILRVSDFSLLFHHDLNMSQLSCTISASLDLFNRETIKNISQRFHSILHELSTSMIDNQINKPIYEISSALSNERYLMQSLNNTQISFSSPLTCIHHEFVCQVMKHPQKLAVELDEQSLTYCELLYYVQVLSVTLLNEYHVFPGEVVCQCVERSLSMVIGIMGIEMAGGVYCPLSPENPEQRLQNLVEQTQARLIVVHSLTNRIFKNNFITYDIDTAININDKITNDDPYQLSNTSITPDDISYIVFTSGSTGIPKAVQVRHRNLTAYMQSVAKMTTLKKSDNVIQMASCSFDTHFQDTFVALMSGAGLVMLHPHGNKDLTYLIHELVGKDVTFMDAVPSYLDTLCQHLEIQNATECLKKLRTLCSGGDILTNQIMSRLKKYVSVPSSLSSSGGCQLWNVYGPAEATITTTYFQIGFDFDCDKQLMSIGKLLPNYICAIMDDYFQFAVVNQEGELFVGGACVFAGYFGRDDLTAKVLVEINNDVFYRSGDVVQCDYQGLLYFKCRKDHQVKLRGQRIELAEIEKCLMNTSSLVSTCVVIKWNDDYLVAYVQSSHTNEEQLRQHCQSHLPPHMIPSIFIILNKLPLNQNGKIDRKLLPSPHFSSKHLTNSIELLLPINDFEVNLHRIWCDILKQNQISTDTNIFTIGGHSLIIMQLFHRYKSEFHLETNALSITDLFQHPTIIHHAQLIQQSINTIHSLDDYHWSSLYLIQAGASFAQQRIYLDEQIRFSSKTTRNNTYVIPLLYRILSTNDNVSITRLQHAFQSIIKKHQILRTALYIDDTNSNIIQHCLDANIILNNDLEACRLTVVNLHNDDRRHMNKIIEEILNQADLFDLSNGRVIRCHILRHYHQSQDSISFADDDQLSENDHILISIHHAMFDGASTSLFLQDLSLAYQSNDLLRIDDNSFQYIDYSIHEHIMDMTLSREFWHSQLEGYNLTRQLSLPADRQRSSINQQRSGLASSAQITFDDEICRSFLTYASTHHFTLFQLGLSIFYVFLFKLTHGEIDLCISSIYANRYRSELVNLIGMFVSTLPYRVELEPYWPFHEVVKYVQEKCLSILKHSHYPLQHILADLYLTQSNVSFLETMFDFITVSKDVEYLCLNDTDLEQVLLEQSAEVSKFDFSLTFQYNSLPDNRRLSCSFVCSHDLFEKSTISEIGHRFEYMFEQLFQTQSSNVPTINMSSSINNVCVILPEEAEEMELVVFYRLENIVNEAPASFAQARIWLDERIRFDPDKPQVAIYNMPFVYRLQSGHTLSIKQLRHALHLTVKKHPSLHTSLHFDIQKNLLMQRVITHEDNYTDMFSIIETAYETDEQLNEILLNEKRNPHLFNLAQGLISRCHLVYYKQISSNHLLSHKDILIFNFHHAFFDFPSMKVFHHDLNQAYTTRQLPNNDNNNLRYLDYAVIEQQMSMTGASMFWLDALHDCKLDQSLSLPFDRYRLSNEHRTGRGTTISFDFGQNLSHHFLTHASSDNISLEQLALATYYVFLFKLTNGENDLCIGINTHGRYRDELSSIIGMFVNAIPLRCQINPHLSFHKLTKHVQDIMLNCIKYSYFPLQRILNQHPNISNPVFLDTSLEFISYKSNNAIMIGDSQLVPAPFPFNMNEDERLSASDFSLSICHDMNMNQLSCTINASLDLFNRETVENISQRFHSILHQLSASIIDSQINKPIYEVSLTLSNEQYLMQSLNNTQISFSSALTCIHHEFVYRVMRHPQKLAVELDEQSLTYCELLYYVQVLSFTLLNEYHVFQGEVVCQCVERSLSMVIGIMGIEMAGGVYCPLSPRDPQHRLHTLTQQTQSRLVLVHHLTKSKFHYNIVILDIDLIVCGNERRDKGAVDGLSNILVKEDDTAYIIFTSGSTGTPKVVQVRHGNFNQYIYSLVCGDVLKEKDTIIQIARCSFDVHVQEILGTLTTGATLVMLHSGGITDPKYLADIIKKKNITCITAVPTILQILFAFLQQSTDMSALMSLRCICTGGEMWSDSLVTLIFSSVANDCKLWNLYGPAETTIVCTVYRINLMANTQSIAIGRPLSNYRCMIMNQYLQSSVTGQEGELLIGGVGVFAGYLGRDDLTAKALVEVDDEIFYRTGDLVRIDSNGLLHYQGRKDHQIKLHGQRIELGEIERCLLSITSISACVVMKWNDDYLVAYVQSSHTNEEQLRQHCQSHLPPHMIPSIFIILN